MNTWLHEYVIINLYKQMDKKETSKINQNLP